MPIQDSREILKQITVLRSVLLLHRNKQLREIIKNYSKICKSKRKVRSSKQVKELAFKYEEKNRKLDEKLDKEFLLRTAEEIKKGIQFANTQKQLDRARNQIASIDDSAVAKGFKQNDLYERAEKKQTELNKRRNNRIENEVDKVIEAKFNFGIIGYNLT